MAAPGFTVRDSARLVTGVLLVTCTVLAGCTGAQDLPASMPTTTTSAEWSSLDEARDIMGYFNLPLPADAENVQVVKPPLERFRAKALVSFTAPREQVINETCKNVKTKTFDSPPLMGGYDDDILSFAGVEIDRASYGSCYQYEGGRKIDVLVPRSEGGTTYIVLYHVPAR